MSFLKPAGWLVLAGCCATAVAHAQSPPAAQPAAAPPLYRSALEGYRPFADWKVAPWKDSNETVRQVGGWRAYAREGREAASSAAPAPAASPAQGEHKH
jgi:hypothetical protein